MRYLLLLLSVLAISGCTRWSLDKALDRAYLAYQNGDCQRVMVELSRAERLSRSRKYLQPEISLLRGQCLERQKQFIDAAQTYRFILQNHAGTEYAYRADARLKTLQALGHISSEAARK